MGDCTMQDDSVSVVLGHATRTGGKQETPRRAKRARSPPGLSADIVDNNGFEVASSGPVEVDHSLAIAEWLTKRGGKHQRLKANEFVEVLKAKLDQEHQLRAAAQSGNKALLLHILTQMENVGSGKRVDTTDLHDGHTALWHAVAAGHYEVAECLLAAGASPHVRPAPIQLQTPFDLAKAQLEKADAREKNHWKSILASMRESST